MAEALNWISAKDALMRMTSDGKNPSTAQETLASYLRLGILRARAELVWYSEKADLSKAWKPIPGDAERDVELQAKTWRTHKDWARDITE
jgi:hypothetical protein